ncbi:MAG: hypothetical protein FI687_04105 [SAR202 cluster bacterium]|nr:hypothetical protein [SAR202 cluster bacterium]|tara:strand:+ start:25706 stop:26056 length:351 start_codon:yes stop_codon:yes gene_type:complete
MNKVILICGIVISLIFIIFILIRINTSDTKVQVTYSTGEQTCKQFEVLLNSVNTLPDVEFQKAAEKLEIISRNSEPAFVEAARAVASSLVPTVKMESFLMLSDKMINLCKKEGFWN